MPQLKGSVQSAPNKSLGFDADSKISLETAQRFAADGYKFCVRYLSLGPEESPQDLTFQEASDILEGGLALMPVQHVLEPGWAASGELGTSHGANAANNAVRLGFPPKVNVWLDLEGIREGTPANDVTAYCTNWFNAVEAAGFVPGLYVGTPCGLNSQELYELPFQHFWKSESGNTPMVAVRSYQMVQSFVREPVNGIGIDKDITYIDDKGGVPQWLIQ